MDLSSDTLIKVAAGAGAAFLLLGPNLSQIGKKINERIMSWLTTPTTPVEPNEIRDMQYVLGIAHRLRQSGNLEAAAIAQQLLDAMIVPPKSNAKK